MNMPWLNYVNGSWLEGLLRGFNTIFTLDDHYVTGGQGQMIAAKLAQFDIELQKDIYLYGINEIPACGTNEEVLKYHGLDAESLSQTFAQKISGI
jgi:transketolase